VSFQSHQGSLSGVAVAPDGKRMLSIAADAKVMFYPANQQGPVLLNKCKSEGVAVAMAPDGKFAVFCDGGEITVFDMVKMKPRKSFFNSRGGLTALEIDPATGMIVTGSTDGTIRFWTGDRDTPESTLDLSNAPITSLAVSADGKLAVAGFADGMLCAIDMKKHRDIKKWSAAVKQRINAVAIAPDGKRCVSAAEDKVAKEWETTTGKPLHKFTGHDGYILGIRWTADGNRIVTAGIDKRVILWDTQSGNQLKQLGQTEAKVYCLGIDAKDRFVVAGLANGVVERLPLPPSTPPKEDPKPDGN
jgi:WD40 repeat protein